MIWRSKLNNVLLVVTLIISETVQYKDKLGRTVTEVKELRLTNSELKAAKYSSDSNLRKLSLTLRAMNIKERNVERAITYNNRITDTIRVVMRDTIVLFGSDSSWLETLNYDDGFMELGISKPVDSDTAIVNYNYEDECAVILHRERERNAKGAEVFILWRWLKDWVYSADVCSSNPKARIISSQYLKVEKHRGEDR